MSWALNYLTKRALEKQGKRWFWRLAKLPKAKRRAALERIRAATSSSVNYSDPERVTWGELARFGKTRGETPGYYPRINAAISRAVNRATKLEAKKGKGREIRDTSWAVKYPQLTGLLPPSFTAPERYPTYPGSYLGRLIRSGKPILTKDLATDPRRYVYRGTSEEVASRPGKFLFASGYPEVAVGYTRKVRDFNPLLLQVKTPKGALFTPHLSETLKRDRLVRLEELKRKGVSRVAGRDPAGDLPFYETVLEDLPSKSVVRRFRPESRVEFTPGGTLAGLKSTRLLPMQEQSARLKKKIEQADKMWHRPVLSRILKGFET